MAARCVEVFVLGSGCSEGVPRVSCLVGGQCSVCLDAARKDVRSPNLRRPPALLLRFDRPEDQSRKYNVLIDCGKFFWQVQKTPKTNRPRQPWSGFQSYESIRSMQWS
eukprot:TRINITY_DN19352_c0_g1_i2.p2 TRINITY_DN19352_c0_g1~~TRINITY_DN19352_c0_g1_i2.p2  ORF type:complete len:115 (-),score=3.42 TRINITY_DN19352_c0_g1_i2:610-933(-)